MTSGPVWPQVLANLGSLGHKIEFKASIALQLRRRRQLEELGIFDGTRIGYPNRYSGTYSSLPTTPTWWAELAQRADRSGRQYVMVRAEQLRWITSQLADQTLRPPVQ